MWLLVLKKKRFSLCYFFVATYAVATLTLLNKIKCHTFGDLLRPHFLSISDVKNHPIDTEVVILWLMLLSWHNVATKNSFPLTLKTRTYQILGLGSPFQYLYKGARLLDLQHRYFINFFLWLQAKNVCE